MSSSRNVCFTLNNYTEEDKEKLRTWELIGYLIMGYEVGECGTPHIQGYIEFKTTVRFTALKKFNERIHWEARKGKQEQAIDYCKKDGNYEEIGVAKVNKQGTRNDITESLKTVSKHGMRKLMENPPNFQNIRICEKYLTYNEEKRTWKPMVYWIYGESGTGKSRHAFEAAGDDFYVKDCTKWWDGYDKHETVILDDFRAHQMRMTYLLRILDRYAMQVEVKGGYRQLLCKTIYITSIKHPRETYNAEEEPIQQLLRRIDTIIHKMGVLSVAMNVDEPIVKKKNRISANGMAVTSVNYQCKD